MSILEEWRKIESLKELNGSHHKHFHLNLNSILSARACKFNLISRDIILQYYWLMFLHRRFIFIDEAHFLGFKFTGVMQSFLSSQYH